MQDPEFYQFLQEHDQDLLEFEDDEEVGFHYYATWVSCYTHTYKYL